MHQGVCRVSEEGYVGAPRCGRLVLRWVPPLGRATTPGHPDTFSPSRARQLCTHPGAMEPGSLRSTRGQRIVPAGGLAAGIEHAGQRSGYIPPRRRENEVRLLASPCLNRIATSIDLRLLSPPKRSPNNAPFFIDTSLSIQLRAVYSWHAATHTMEQIHGGQGKKMMCDV